MATCWYNNDLLRFGNLPITPYKCLYFWPKYSNFITALIRVMHLTLFYVSKTFGSRLIDPSSRITTLSTEINSVFQLGLHKQFSGKRRVFTAACTVESLSAKNKFRDKFSRFIQQNYYFLPLLSISSKLYLRWVIKKARGMIH